MQGEQQARRQKNPPPRRRRRMSHPNQEKSSSNSRRSPRRGSKTARTLPSVASPATLAFALLSPLIVAAFCSAREAACGAVDGFTARINRVDLVGRRRLNRTNGISSMKNLLQIQPPPPPPNGDSVPSASAAAAAVVHQFLTKSASSGIRRRDFSASAAGAGKTTFLADSTALVLNSLRGGQKAAAVPPPQVGVAQATTTGALLLTLARKVIANVGASTAKCWIVLTMSILGESWASCLSKLAKEKGSVEIFVGACFVYLLTMFGFNLSLAKIEVGVAYAVWSALGSLIVSGVGILFFGEAYDAWKLTCLALITVGVVGLNLRP